MAAAHHSDSPPAPSVDGRVVRALIENLYCELLLLIDEARAEPASDEHALLPHVKVQIAAESLHLSARLLHMLQWLVEARDALRSGGSLPDAGRVPTSLPWTDDLPPQLREHRDTALRLAQRIHDIAGYGDAAMAASVPQMQLARLHQFFPATAA